MLLTLYLGMWHAEVVRGRAGMTSGGIFGNCFDVSISAARVGALRARTYTEIKKVKAEVKWLQKNELKRHDR